MSSESDHAAAHGSGRERCHYCQLAVDGRFFTRWAVTRDTEILCCANCWDDAMILHEAPGPSRMARLRDIVEHPRELVMPGTDLGQQLHMPPEAAAEWARQGIEGSQ